MFYKPPDSSLKSSTSASAQALGGPVPSRPTHHPRTEVPSLQDYAAFVKDSGGKPISTTMGFVRLLSKLCKDKKIGKYIVPIVPDESRTFGMEGMFREVGIYALGAAIRAGRFGTAAVLQGGPRRSDPGRGHHRGRSMSSFNAAEHRMPPTGST